MIEALLTFLVCVAVLGWPVWYWIGLNDGVRIERLRRD